MNTRYSSLVVLKKNTVDKIERELQQLHRDLRGAENALQESKIFLESLQIPQTGTIAQIKASSLLFHSQRTQIKQNQEKIYTLESKIQQTKNNLKKEMIEYEKFKYLELEEIKKRLKEAKIAESKELDEIALMTFKRKII